MWGVRCGCLRARRSHNVTIAGCAVWVFAGAEVALCHYYDSDSDNEECSDARERRAPGSSGLQSQTADAHQGEQGVVTG